MASQNVALYKNLSCAQNLAFFGAVYGLHGHLLDEAEALCTRIGVLRGGTLVATGTPESLRARIPAVEIATVQSPEPERVALAAAGRGLATRRHEQSVVIWLARHFDLRERVDIFDGIAVTSIARHPVTLEDAYMELVAGHEGPASK